jgi:hypothetical protein
MFHHHHHHHQQDVQQYIMHPVDPRTAGYPGHNNIPPHQHHHYAGPYPPHATPESYRPSIPQEIFSTPANNGTNIMGTTVSNLKTYHPAVAHNGTPANVTTTKVASSSGTKNGETSTTVVTTIANDTMVSSTCWANENSNNGLSTIHSESHDSNNNTP